MRYNQHYAYSSSCSYYSKPSGLSKLPEELFRSEMKHNPSLTKAILLKTNAPKQSFVALMWNRETLSFKVLCLPISSECSVLGFSTYA